MIKLCVRALAKNRGHLPRERISRRAVVDAAVLYLCLDMDEEGYFRSGDRAAAAASFNPKES